MSSRDRDKERSTDRHRNLKRKPLSERPLTGSSFWSSSSGSVAAGSPPRPATTAALNRNSSRGKHNSNNGSGIGSGRGSGKLGSSRLGRALQEGLDRLFVQSSQSHGSRHREEGVVDQPHSKGTHHFNNLVKTASARNLKVAFGESTQKLKDSFMEYAAKHNLFPPRETRTTGAAYNEENKENTYIPTQIAPLKRPEELHHCAKNTTHSLPPNYTVPIRQDRLPGALSPGAVAPTNIRFVPTEEHEVRDRQVAQALNIISQSMEPPVHNVDRFRDWILQVFRPAEDATEGQKWLYSLLAYIMDIPFTVVRAFWHYVVLEIHLVYNLGLLYVAFIETPPIIYFVIGITLFWLRILYELYRDILHRDDPLYASVVPKEMSIAAAISATMGFVLNLKAQKGELGASWWAGGKAQ